LVSSALTKIARIGGTPVRASSSPMKSIPNSPSTSESFSWLELPSTDRALDCARSASGTPMSAESATEERPSAICSSPSSSISPLD
jgi:hypothetical protein